MTASAHSKTTLDKLNQLAQLRQQSIDSLLDELIAQHTLPPEPDPLPFDILELATDAIVALDENLRVNYFSTGAEQLFGYSEDEIIGQSLNKLLPEAAHLTHNDYIRRFAQGDADSRHMAARQPISGRHKDGTLFPIEVSILRYYRGEQMHYAALVRNITERERIAQELRERHNILAMLTDYTTDLVCLHDSDGTYRYVSPSVARIGGYTPEELIGTNPYDCFHPDDLAAIQRSHNRALNRDGIPVVIYRFRRKDGSYIWLETRTNTVTDAEGHVTNLVTVSRDITEQRRIQEELEAEHALLDQIMATSPSAITVVDKNGSIVFANRRAMQIYGAPEEDITKRSYDSPEWRHTDYDGNPWPDENQPFVRVMQTRQPVRDVRHAIEWSNGQRVYLSINGAPILDANGEVSQVVFTIEDYTLMKQQQDQLEAALLREKELNRMKSAFVSMVTHEFRTPMAVIMTSTSILRMKRDHLTPQEIEVRLNRIDEQIKRLNTLIEEVTFINRDELVGHELILSTLSLKLFTLQIIEEIAVTYPDHAPVQFVVADNCDTIRTDKALFQQIVMNLVSNAVKYSPKDKPAQCTITCTATEFVLVVKDNGIGIPESSQPYLFDIFHRAENVGDISGTGLGLHIVKRAVTVLGGSISYESTEGVGTTFTVRLPKTIRVHD